MLPQKRREGKQALQHDDLHPEGQLAAGVGEGHCPFPAGLGDDLRFRAGLLPAGSIFWLTFLPGGILPFFLSIRLPLQLSLQRPVILRFFLRVFQGLIGFVQQLGAFQRNALVYVPLVRVEEQDLLLISSAKLLGRITEARDPEDRIIVLHRFV